MVRARSVLLPAVIVRPLPPPALVRPAPVMMMRGVPAYPGCVLPSMITGSMILGSGDNTDIVTGLMAPPCTTANVRPAMVMAPVRAVLEVFAATAKVTAPDPLPVVLEVILTKPVLLVAVQAQPAGAVTFTVP